MDNWQAPAGHPISVEQAKALMAGDPGNVYRSILKTSCAPICWYRIDRQDLPILHNGTVTFVRTPERVPAVTAAHVPRACLTDTESGAVRLQIHNSVVDDLPNRIIDIADKLDIATFAVDDALLHSADKAIVPLANWPPRPPQEGQGIMLSGYPAVERIVESNQVNFGLFTALAIARTVTDVQITWLIEPEEYVANANIPAPPLQYGLGGISGGPLTSGFESERHVAIYGLSGIITEHPDYAQNEFSVERVIAVRADFIRASGRIGDY